MAIYRSVHTTFWTDTKIADDFSPEDKYFMLYCLTNPYTNIIGCYEISIRQIANDMGYSRDAVESLLKRFKEHHKIIDYDFETKELFIKNWYKYNWTNSPKLDQPLLTAIKGVKNDAFRNEIIDLYNSRDTVSLPYEYDSDTTDTDTVSITETITEIISYLNSVLKTRYRVNNKVTQKHIKARLSEGYTVDDFKTVIDKKVAEWRGSEMEQYLRPETLFGTKFESYLNATINKPAPTQTQARQQESAIDRANRFLAMYEQEGSGNA
ncbi:MAG: conserved phage C-terminal domain-containing protein [Christensenellales bacterium]